LAQRPERQPRGEQARAAEAHAEHEILKNFLGHQVTPLKVVLVPRNHYAQHNTSLRALYGKA